MNPDQMPVDVPGIDLSRVLTDPDPSGQRPRRNIQPRNDPPAQPTLDDWLLEAAWPAVERGEPVRVQSRIRNTDRTVGARLAGAIGAQFGDGGLPPGRVVAEFEGSAGQSFGAFCINGLKLVLYGEANDYVGKGMAGGEIIVRLPRTARYASQDNYIIGNTVLYGATAGLLLAAGRAGERFCVRNSGATAVVEGVGDHGCEYMTGGQVVVLGPVGRNFGAGMTGGMAYVYDPDHRLHLFLNDELVSVQPLPADEAGRVQALIGQHAEATGSTWSRHLLDQWSITQQDIYQIRPK